MTRLLVTALTAASIAQAAEPDREGTAFFESRIRQTPSHPVPALRPGSTRLRPLKSNFLADQSVRNPAMLRNLRGLVVLF